MPNSNFRDLRALQAQIISYGNGTIGYKTLLTDLSAIAMQDSSKDFPFSLGIDARDSSEAQSLIIAPSSYLKYLNSGSSIVPISHSDAYWLNRVQIPIIAPKSLGVESVTLAIAWGALLPIYQDIFAALLPNEIESRAAIYASLFFTCIILYPLFYEWASICGKVEKVSRQQTIAEALRLFIGISCATAGYDVFTGPDFGLSHEVASFVAATIASLSSDFFNRFRYSTEWSSTTSFESFMTIVGSILWRFPLLYILKNLPFWLPPQVLAYLPGIRAVTILVGVNLWTRAIYRGYDELRKFFYALPDFQGDQKPLLRDNDEFYINSPPVAASLTATPTPPGGYLGD